MQPQADSRRRRFGLLWASALALALAGSFTMLAMAGTTSRADFVFGQNGKFSGGLGG
jgi:hypothetical protein